MQSGLLKKNPHRSQQEVYGEILSLFLQNGGRVKNTENAIRKSARLDFVTTKKRINFLLNKDYIIREEESGQVLFAITDKGV